MEDKVIITKITDYVWFIDQGKELPRRHTKQVFRSEREAIGFAKLKNWEVDKVIVH